MAFDVNKKFLDQQGVSTLWGKINEQLSARDAVINEVKADLGNVDNLTTTSKEVVGAVNELKQLVDNNNLAGKITLNTDSTTEGMAKSYTIKQGETTVGVIDIPKDMVVSSGEVVELVEGQVEGKPAGTYIKLTLANAQEPLYINAADLVDVYIAEAGATQVQLAIENNIISATIVAGSIGTAELADNAIVTAKIADANVTKAKLSAEVQASLDKADASASDADLTAAKNRITALEGKVGDAEGTVADWIATAKSEAVEAAATDASTKAQTVYDNIVALSTAEIEAAIAGV